MLLSKKLTRLALWLYCISLVLPTFYLGERNPQLWGPGLGVLVFGALGIFASVIAWYANPALLISWLMYKRNNFSGAIVLAILALALALSFLVHENMPLGRSGIGSEAKVMKIGLGYWVWLASILSMLAASAIALRDKKQGAD